MKIKPRTFDNIIALDAMSGDTHPRFFVRAAISALKRYNSLQIILVGQKPLLESIIQSCHSSLSTSLLSRLSIHHAETVVGMSDKPSSALRNGRDSSLWGAVDLVKKQEATACVSGGNTGAYMAIGLYLLGTFSHVNRPAIIGRLPGINRHSFMMDLGANVTVSPKQLHQFAVMGSLFLSEVHGISSPSVGLLNIGKEKNKGNDLIKEARHLMEEDPALNFVRYIEGHELYSGVIDLVVCDGFSGNIALKSSEGTARYIRRFLLGGHKSWMEKIMFWMATPWIKCRVAAMDPGMYNGATLLGLRGILVKSHGAAHVGHILCAIEQAVVEIRHGAHNNIAEKLAQDDII